MSDKKRRQSAGGSSPSPKRFQSDDTEEVEESQSAVNVRDEPQSAVGDEPELEFEVFNAPGSSEPDATLDPSTSRQQKSGDDSEVSDSNASTDSNPIEFRKLNLGSLFGGITQRIATDADVGDHSPRPASPKDRELMFDTIEDEDEEYSADTLYASDTDLDAIKLQQRGIHIDFDTGFIGSGVTGRVYSGWCGQEITNLRDSTGQPVPTLVPYKRIAVKCIAMTTEDPKNRISLEIEKEVLKSISHRNITAFHIHIHMGPKRWVRYEDPDRGFQFRSYDRQYILMDLADQGNIEPFMKDSGKWTGTLCCQLILDLFNGIRYLHNEDIVHGDIHTGNILIFTDPEANQDDDSDGGFIAKWTDFGLSVWRQHWSSSYVTDQEFTELIQLDMQNMAIVFKDMMRNAKTLCHPLDVQLDDWKPLLQLLNSTDNLNDIVDRFSFEVQEI